MLPLRVVTLPYYLLAIACLLLGGTVGWCFWFKFVHPAILAWALTH